MFVDALDDDEEEEEEEGEEEDREVIPNEADAALISANIYSTNKMTRLKRSSGWNR